LDTKIRLQWKYFTKYGIKIFFEKKLTLMKKIFTLFYFLIAVAYFSYSQNVGIGTPTPAFKLDVKNGSINTDSSYRIGGSKILSANLQNTFIGIGTANGITTGNFNTAVGYESLFSNTTGERNTAFGLWSLRSNISGNYNTAIGKSALHENLTGSFNSATGYEALYYNTGSNNTADGYHALLFNSTGSFNTATGSGALRGNTTGTANTATGNDALINNTQGLYNTGIGFQALRLNSTGDYNTAIGYQALHTNTSDNCTAIGKSALSSNTAGSDNVAIGADALRSVITGDWNTAVGTRALEFVTGTGNTGVGINALHNTTNANRNIGIGQAAGRLYANGSDNIFIGPFTDVTGPGFTNVIALGNGTTVAANYTARFGSALTSSYGGWAGWSNVSDGRFKTDVKENVPGISFIEKLRPVTYKLKATEMDAFYHQNDKDKAAKLRKDYQAGLAEKEKITFTGFIAQEVEAAAKQSGFDFSGVDKAKNENDTYGLRYAEFVVPLVKAVQELSNENENFKKQNEELLKRIEKLESFLASKK
jgi:trimeric autotransporter adhesin